MGPPLGGGWFLSSAQKFVVFFLTLSSMSNTSEIIAILETLGILPLDLVSSCPQ